MCYSMGIIHRRNTRLRPVVAGVMEYYLTWLTLTAYATDETRVKLPPGHRVHTYIKEGAGQILVLIEINSYKEVETRAS